MTTKKAPPRGRPPLADAEKRDQLVQFRTTEGERQEIDQAADAKGQRLSDWLRDVVLKAARRAK